MPFPSKKPGGLEAVKRSFLPENSTIKDDLQHIFILTESNNVLAAGAIDLINELKNVLSDIKTNEASSNSRVENTLDTIQRISEGLLAEIARLQGMLPNIGKFQGPTVSEGNLTEVKSRLETITSAVQQIKSTLDYVPKGQQTEFGTKYIERELRDISARQEEFQEAFDKLETSTGELTKALKKFLEENILDKKLGEMADQIATAVRIILVSNGYSEKGEKKELLNRVFDKVVAKMGDWLIGVIAGVIILWLVNNYLDTNRRQSIETEKILRNTINELVYPAESSTEKKEKKSQSSAE